MLSKLKLKNKKKTIFLTGGSGFIGSNIINYLKQKNYVLIILSRKKKKSKYKNIFYLHSDLNNFDKSILKKCEYLMHFATTDTSNFDADFENTYKTNVIDSIELIDSAIKNGVKKILIAGSCYEYGKTGEIFKTLSTNAKLLPIGYYAYSKASFYLQLQNLLKKTKKNIKVFYARFFQVYGEYEKKTRLYPTVISAAKSNTKISIKNPHYLRDFIDVKTASILTLEKFFKNTKKIAISNIATGKPTSIIKFSNSTWKKYNKRKSKISYNKSKSKNSHVSSLIAKI